MVTSQPNKARPTLRAVGDETSLLGLDEGSPVDLVNADGENTILLVCEHASNRIPAALDNLGLDPEVLESHVAWDPGAAEVAQAMSEQLDAPLFLQRFSRLVYDCNRPPDAPSAMPEKSEIYDIPGNQNLSAADRDKRTAALYTPFHNAIERHLDAAMAAGQAPLIVTIHSFTPIYHGQPRAVELGLLHDRDDRLARIILELGRAMDDADIRLNEPYAPTDGVMHTIQRHALPRGLLNVMIEIRNDLIHDRAGQARFAKNLAQMVSQAQDQLSRPEATLKRHLSGGP